MTSGWVASGLLVALCAAAPAPAGDAEQAVLTAQDRRVAATLANDLESLGNMMTDDLSYTHSSAVVDTKARFLDALRTGKTRYRSLTFDERHVRLFGDVAVIAGTCHVLVTAGGRDLDIRLRFTELYAKQAGAWKMALWHSTRVPDPAP